VRLTHYCGLKECYGLPGDIVDAPRSLVEQWLLSGGCVLFDEDQDAKSLRAAEDDRAKGDAS
jgi:hypothetical protein